MDGQWHLASFLHPPWRLHSRSWCSRGWSGRCIRHRQRSKEDIGPQRPPRASARASGRLCSLLSVLTLTGSGRAPGLRSRPGCLSSKQKLRLVQTPLGSAELLHDAASKGVVDSAPMQSELFKYVPSVAAPRKMVLPWFFFSRDCLNASCATMRGRC